jgi:hypothetical protein
VWQEDRTTQQLSEMEIEVFDARIEEGGIENATNQTHTAAEYS